MFLERYYIFQTMMRREESFLSIYQGMALMADPIYSYTTFTVPDTEDRREKTEKDLIDSPWMQRLRRIYQLQSARWVYPGAEHTRFQHSLGTMHVAGEFARHLYPSLSRWCNDVPSACYVEELLRVAGLLHDIGHGPYGHFFDDNYLNAFGVTHEDVGTEIIVKKLGDLIGGIRRSPSGPFASGERLDPRQVAFLIKAPDGREKGTPRWLGMLRQLFSGVYTVDNLDYVQRDAYMTGFSMDMVDVDRLRYYSFFAEEGLALHQAGLSALGRFLNARLNLYANVYFHRTTRALDLHLQEIFRSTMERIFPGNPVQHLDAYLELDEWSLFATVRSWQRDGDPIKRRLGREWAKLHGRQVKWKMSFSTEIHLGEMQRGLRMAETEECERRIREQLPKHLKRLPMIVDVAAQDPRPINPMAQTSKRITIYDPATGRISQEPLMELYRFIPARLLHFRIFSLNHRHDQELSLAAEKALGAVDGQYRTNL